LNIYRIFTESGRYQFLMPEGVEVSDQIADLSGFRAGDAIPEVLPVRLVATNEKGHELESTDVPWIAGNLPAYSDEAFEALAPLLLKHGRAIRLEAVDDRGSWLGLQVDRVLDVLDHDRSVLTRFSSGRLMKIDRHVFRTDAIGDAAIFRLPDFDRSGWIYVTDEYVSALRAAKLRGGEFDSVWMPSPEGSVLAQ
jgi:hypothetical protein